MSKYYSRPPLVPLRKKQQLPARSEKTLMASPSHPDNYVLDFSVDIAYFGFPLRIREEIAE